MAKKKRTRREDRDGQIVVEGDRYRVRLQVGTDPVTGKARYRSVRCDSKHEAAEVLRKMHAELQSGQLAPASGQNLASYLERWLEIQVQPNLALKTVRQYEYLVNEHIIPHLGKMRPEKVTREHVQKLIALKTTQVVASRAKDGNSQPTKTLSRSTLRLIRAVLHRAFQDAIRDKVVSTNPVGHAVLPKAIAKETVHLNLEESRRFLKVAEDSDLRELWLFFMMTGTRLGEATGVRWKDINWDAKTVRIIGQLQRVDGKLQYVLGTKTNQIRVLQLSDPLVEALKGIKDWQDQVGITDPDGIVFLNSEGRRLDPKFVRDRLNDVCTKAELPRISPHALRHTAATLAHSATGDIHAVQKLLGHSQVSLTANLYAHSSDLAQKKVADALSGVLFGGS